jgi:CRISPR-associated protein Cmr1
MKTITFTCQSITPMLLSGADGQRPELRPPSIKGVLRFWWRAMNGHLKLENLKKQEAMIFGSANEKLGGRSKVRIKCKVLSHGQKLKIDSVEKNVFTGFHYLFYSAYMNKREYLPNLVFEISLSSHDSDCLLSASYAMWLLSNLGGLGTRARRGGGNFLIDKVEDEKGILSNFSFINQATNITELQNYLRENIEVIRDYFKITSKTRKTIFNTFEKYNVHLIDYSDRNIDLEDSTNVLNEIGLDFQTFRDGRTRGNLSANDYDSVKEFIKKGTIPQTIEKANFGLPISYQYSSLKINNKPARATIEGKNRGKNLERSASSLIISLSKVGNHFYPIITNFDSRLLPVGAELKISTKGKKPDFFAKPNNTIKEDFISTLPNISI